MKEMIIKAINERFVDDVATITMKDKNKTVVTICRRVDFLADFYEVSWGFNGSCGRYVDTIEEVADIIMNFDEINNDCIKNKAKMMDYVMQLQMMIEGTIKATPDEISELRSFLSDWSKDYYHIRYRTKMER